MFHRENDDEPFVEETNEAERNAFNIINVPYISFNIDSTTSWEENVVQNYFSCEAKLLQIYTSENRRSIYSCFNISMR